MVTTREDMAVVGYIRRQILQRMIDVALEEEAVRPDTPCIFSRRSRTCHRVHEQGVMLGYLGGMPACAGARGPPHLQLRRLA